MPDIESFEKLIHSLNSAVQKDLINDMFEISYYVGTVGDSHEAIHQRRGYDAADDMVERIDSMHSYKGGDARDFQKKVMHVGFQRLCADATKKFGNAERDNLLKTILLKGLEQKQQEFNLLNRLQRNPVWKKAEVESDLDIEPVADRLRAEWQVMKQLFPDICQSIQSEVDKFIAQVQEPQRSEPKAKPEGLLLRLFKGRK